MKRFRRWFKRIYFPLIYFIGHYKVRVQKWIGRPVFISFYPWYDSQWLSSYRSARDYLARRCPRRLKEFEDSMKVFQTPQTFLPVELKSFCSKKELNEIRKLIKSIHPTLLEDQERGYFGRDVCHNHPFFNELQKKWTPLVSQRVGEEVEPSYNFLSLYDDLGQCPVHMDAMSAKWTLDLCIDQSHEWPIYFSDVRPWLEPLKIKTKQWEHEIKSQNRFKKIILTPGDAVIFSGSSQWHYRDRIERSRGDEFCHLVFFHFIPKGSKPLSSPPEWSEYFKIPKLKSCAPYSEDLL